MSSNEHQQEEKGDYTEVGRMMNIERLIAELKINSETIARIAQDNRALRAYITELERENVELKQKLEGTK